MSANVDWPGRGPLRIRYQPSDPSTARTAQRRSAAAGACLVEVVFGWYDELPVSGHGEFVVLTGQAASQRSSGFGSSVAVACLAGRMTVTAMATEAATMAAATPNEK